MDDIVSNDSLNENDINLKHLKIQFLCDIFDGG